jgi:hypothetical protein
MKAELSNSNVLTGCFAIQIPITRKRVPEQYQIFQIRNGKAFTRFRSFDIQRLFPYRMLRYGIWSLDIGYCSAGNAG